ncbi:phosphoribosylanthranilate isomerase [Alkalibacillus silvisoli]|uniref:N-(5'-phosphoribosyl)anthranilate isomerase n=1 Tax=Alkalibacillus silvisoli TaxID=392823 RepID=A0ABP3JF51_9BACI
MTRVKICGIRHTENAIEATKRGADMIGFVFAKSKRQVTVEQAKQIASSLPTNIKKVGVFVNASQEELEATAHSVGLDYVQLHGDESLKFCQQLSIPYIKSFRVQSKDDLEQTKQYNDADYILLDSATGPYRGGNGTQFDWQILNDLPFEHERLILAGGLNQDNVKYAISQTTPKVVDVSSGVEFEGHKSNQLINQFIQSVKECSK